MARLQILPLPEGTGDDRPPFVLVIDQVTDEEGERLADDGGVMDGFGIKAGASAVAVFHGMTVEIPANKPLPLLVEGDAQTDELISAHERTRLELCDALLLSRDTTWHQLTKEAAGRQHTVARLSRQLDRVQNLPETPSIMDAQHPNPNAYLHGYRVAAGDAKRAARDDRPGASGDGG